MAANTGRGSEIHGCDSDKLQVGHFLSRVSYVRVKEILETTVVVENQFDFSWTIGKPIVAKEMVSAHQVDEEKKITRTEIVKILENAGDTIFSVCFTKKISEKPIADRLATLTPEDLESPKKRRALAKEFTHGETRTLVGYLYNADPEMGRSIVIDLEAPEDNYESKKRLVDHRTIEWLIFNKIKYVAK